ncbi:MAG: TIGR00269 family protein [archaeon]|nr:TIGR00269 family protein [archaeon]
MKICNICKNSKPSLKRPKTGELSCIPCFLKSFEDEIHQTIIENKIFNPGEIIVIGISGGKDSTVLAYVLNKLNIEHNYGLNLQLVAIDEGIKGYRDESLETVKLNASKLNLPLTILSYKELYNYTMDEIVELVGLTNSCTYCGVFRRQALDLGAVKLKADKIATGHNADDIAETVLMNILRGDFNRLPGSVDIMTGGGIRRVKPFKYVYEKEIVMYAHFLKLNYFCTECTYSVAAYRGNVRQLIKEMEVDRSMCIIDIIHSGEKFKLDENIKQRQIMNCEKCGMVSSNKFCKACLHIQKLEEEKKKKNKIKIEYD